MRRKALTKMDRSIELINDKEFYQKKIKQYESQIDKIDIKLAELNK